MKKDVVKYGTKTWEAIILPWDKSYLVDFAAKNLGIMAVNPYRKEAFWFETVHDACSYFNVKNNVMGKFDDPKHFVSPNLHCIAGHNLCNKDAGRVYKDYIWFPASMFSEKIIVENIHF